MERVGYDMLCMFLEEEEATDFLNISLPDDDDNNNNNNMVNIIFSVIYFRRFVFANRHFVLPA